jgi:hypothetical protein
MKSGITLRLLFVLSLTFVVIAISCSEEDILETDAELIPYFEIFAEEAAIRGIVVDYEAERIEGLIQDIEESQVLGQCFRNVERPRKVVIDRETWEEANEAKRQFLIFHELGHCFLERGHLDARDEDNNCVSIMHSTTQLCPDFELTDENREFFLDELFDTQ